MHRGEARKEAGTSQGAGGRHVRLGWDTDQEFNRDRGTTGRVSIPGRRVYIPM